MKTAFKALLFLSCLTLLCCQSKKQGDEGFVHYKISYSGNLDRYSIGLMANGLSLWHKGNLLRLEMTGGLGRLMPKVIVNGNKGVIMMRDTGMPKPSFKKLLAQDTSLRSTGDSEILLGHECKVYTAANKNTRYQVWAAEDMALKIIGTSRLNGFYVSRYGGVPLKIIDREQDFTVTYTADSIANLSVPSGLF